MITDLPTEILLIIFEDFDLAELNDVTRSHPFYRRLGEIKFKDLVGERMLKINESGLYVENTNSTDHLGQQIYDNIGDMDVMYSTLKTFGYMFTHLTINYRNFKEWESGKVNARISQYVANTLTELTLHGFCDRNFKHLTGPFKTLETIYFGSCYITSDVGNLTKVFPTVRIFIFEQYQNSESVRGFIGHHFPCLEEITEMAHDSTSNRLEEMFRLNPQLRKLSLQNIYVKFLRSMSELLPELEHLTIHTLWAEGISIEGADIYFGNLKSFEVKMMRDFPREIQRLPIAFGNNLDEIMDWTEKTYLLNNIVENKNLKIVGLGRFGNSQIERIAKELPNLEEFRTGNIWVYESETIRFLEMNKNLKRIELWNCDPAEHATMREKIQDKWRMIEGKHRRNAVFIRRQSLGDEI